MKRLFASGAFGALALILLLTLATGAAPQPAPLAAGEIVGSSLAIGGGFGATGCTLSATGTLQCDGAVTLGSTLTVTGTSNLVGNVADAGGTFTIADDVAITGGDVTISNTSLNAGAKNELIGLSRLKLVALGTMTNGSTETTLYTDDSPAGEWTAISTTVTVSTDATIYRIGAGSLKLAFGATAVDDNGATTDITNDDLSGNESIGFWIYSDTALDAGDLDVLIDDTDASPDSTFDVCAVATVNTWQWCEVNIGALDASTGNVVDKVGFVLKDAAGLGAFNVYIDGMYKWDANDEEALGNAILTDGVYGVLTITTAQDQANTPAALVENTGYFVHYESGSDFLVTITDQSANSGFALIGY